MKASLLARRLLFTTKYGRQLSGPSLMAAREGGLVLCDTCDTSILIVDTYMTIPVSPKSRYTAVYCSIYRGIS